MLGFSSGDQLQGKWNWGISMPNGGFYAKLADPSSMGKLVREVKKFFHVAESLLSYIQSMEMMMNHGCHLFSIRLLHSIYDFIQVTHWWLGVCSCTGTKTGSGGHCTMMLMMMGCYLIDDPCPHCPWWQTYYLYSLLITQKHRRMCHQF